MVDGRARNPAGLARRGGRRHHVRARPVRSARTTSRSSSRTSSPRSSRRRIVAFLRIWSPGEPLRAEIAGGRSPGRPLPAAPCTTRPGARGRAARRQPARTRRQTCSRAYSPYMIIIAVFSIAQIPAVKDCASGVTVDHDLRVARPRRHARQTARRSVASTFKLRLAARPPARCCSSPALVTMAVLGHRAGARAGRPTAETLDQLKWAIVTVAAVLALAYVMNQPG